MTIKHEVLKNIVGQFYMLSTLVLFSQNGANFQQLLTDNLIMLPKIVQNIIFFWTAIVHQNQK